MKKLVTFFLFLILCFKIFAQSGQEITWRHNFVSGDITAENCNSPITLADANGGDALVWNFNATWNTSPYFWGNTESLQIGSKNNSVSSFSLSTNNLAGKVKKISVGAYGRDGVYGELTVSVGNQGLGTESLTSDPETTYSFDTNAEGQVSLNVSQQTSVALYLLFIEIVYEKATATDATITIGESGYATYASDKALDFSQVTDNEGNAADIEAYVVTSYYTNGMVAMMKAGGNAICENRTVPAQTGLVVKGSPGTYHVAYSDAPGNYFANLLKPVISVITLEPTEGEYTNLILTAEGFKPLSTSGPFGPNKAYLQIPTRFLTTNNISVFTLMVDEDIAGIEETTFQERAEGWYTLDGVRISKPTQKGIYLHNGRKVAVCK